MLKSQIRKYESGHLDNREALRPLHPTLSESTAKNARRIQISCGERSHLADAITPASANSLFQATQGSREAMSNAEA
jgi:hypothetical protein